MFGSSGEVAVTSCDVFGGPCVRAQFLNWPFGPSRGLLSGVGYIAIARVPVMEGRTETHFSTILHSSILLREKCGEA